MGSKRFSLAAVLWSLLGGLIAFVIGEILLNNLQGVWPEYVVMGLYFGIGALLIGAMVLVSQIISPQLIGYRWKKKYMKTSLAFFIPVTFVMVGLCGAIAQGLYGFEVSSNKEIKDIMIAIDTSGSMNETDPNGERFKAVSHLVEGLESNMRVAVVTFNDNPKLVFDFKTLQNSTEKAEVQKAISEISNIGEGTTEVKKVIDYSYELINAEQNTGRGASLIFISDGEPTDNSQNDIPLLVENYVANHIPIYTISMMYGQHAGEEYLEQLAVNTGGKYLSTSDTTMIKGAFDKIRYYQGSRSLVGERMGTARNMWTYSLGRILLLVTIGGMLALGLGILFDNKYLAKAFIIGSIIGGCIGGIWLEVLLKNGGSPIWARGIYLLSLSLCLSLFTFVVTFKDSYHGTLKA